MNIIQEPLLIDDTVSGLCLYPDLRNPQAEKMELMDIYRMWARMPKQTHSCQVAVADRNRMYFDDADALLTFEPGVPVGVRTADCVPILIHAVDVQCVGAIHAGWKGTLDGIVDNVMDTLKEAGADPIRVKVAFGPSISKKVYEVDHDLAERFRIAGFGEYVSYPDGYKKKPHIDLQGVNMERFLRRGVRSENMSLHTGCSFGSRNADGIPIYPSHRRSGGMPTRMLTCIMMLSETEKAHYRRLLNGIS